MSTSDTPENSPAQTGDTGQLAPDQQNQLLAQVLLSLQTEDDNPYEVGDEMLVAFCEGRLSEHEASVVQRCLAHNPEALAASILLTREYLARQLAPDKSASILSRIWGWLSEHKGMSFAGAGSALATAFALVLVFTGSVYQALDSEFARYRNQTEKPTVNWGAWVPGVPAESRGIAGARGSDSDPFMHGYGEGIRLGLQAFAHLDAAQKTQLNSVPVAAVDCDPATVKNCAETLKQGRYAGQWVALAYVSCHRATDGATDGAMAEEGRGWIANHRSSLERLIKESQSSSADFLHSGMQRLAQTDSDVDQCAIIQQLLVAE